MKVLHLVAGYPSGGASRGALWLHDGLQHVPDVDSTLLIQHSGSEQHDAANYTVFANTPYKRFKARVIAQVDRSVAGKYSSTPHGIFSPGVVGDNVLQHPLVQQADIIHLHWINNGYLSVKALSRISQPVVWTIRDMWPITGGCHYTGASDYEHIHTGSCPELHSRYLNTLARHMFKLKKRYYPSNLHAVAISTWLETMLTSSPLFAGRHISVIPNGIDLDSFTLTNKLSAREALQLPKSKHYLAFGAISATGDKRKGFHLLQQALQQIDKPEEYHLLIFGKHNSEALAQLGISYTAFGSVQNEDTLSLIYSAADIFIAPSMQEAFGKTVIEAMACGTPVIAFDGTGPKDSIQHMVNGYLAKPFDPQDIIAGITQIRHAQSTNSNTFKPEQIRNHVQQHFTHTLVASRYAEVYRSILSRESY